MTDDDEPTCPRCDAILERKVGTAWPDRTFEGFECPNGCDIREEYM